MKEEKVDFVFVWAWRCGKHLLWGHRMFNHKSDLLETVGTVSADCEAQYIAMISYAEYRRLKAIEKGKR